MFIPVGKKLLNTDHIASVEDMGNCVVVTGRTGHKTEYVGTDAADLMAAISAAANVKIPEKPAEPKKIES